MLTMDAAGQFTGANQRAAAMFGQSMDNLSDPSSSFRGSPESRLGRLRPRPKVSRSREHRRFKRDFAVNVR